MKRRAIFMSFLNRITSLFVLPLLVTSVIFYCGTLPENPTDPSNTEISAVIKTADGKIFKNSLADTVNKKFSIGAALRLPDNFDSIRLSISYKNDTIFDTVFNMHVKTTSYSDTIWTEHTLFSPGIYYATFTPFTSLTTNLNPATIDIMMVEANVMPENHKPSISVSGNTIFKPGDTCVLSITKTDPDTKQLLTTSTKGKPEGSLLKDNKFTWVIPSGFTGMDTISFIVNDNGYPQESDTETVVITVTSTPNVPLITISGDSIVKPLETCKLTIHTSDKDSGQKLVVTMAGQPAGAALVNDSQFTWTAPNVTSAKHVVTFTVTDNGTPPLRASASVTIQVSTETGSQNPTYSVTYNGNGSTSGSVPVDTNKYLNGASVPVAAAGTLVKTGSTFTGWNTNTAGTGTARAAGSSYAIGAANDTLYAQWTTNPTYTVTYNGNGSTSGAVPADANRYLSGASVTVAAAGTLLKTGSIFTGWNTNAAGTGIARAAGSSYAIGAANDTLYAQWTTNPTYTVTYNGNGSTSGAVPADANRYLSGASVTVAVAGTLAKTGSTFTGWNTNAAGTGTARAAGSSYAIGAANDTLYAQWTQNPTYTVTYNGNGSTSGSVPADANRYLSGASVTVAAAGTLVKTGSTFTGWNTNTAGTGTARAAGSSYAIGAANDTLYAQWTQNPTYTVTYNGNGSTSGAVPADANRYLSGATVTVAVAGTLAKTGSTFTGWNTNAAGTGTARAAGSSYAIGAANDTLYAQWTQNPTYTVTYNGNGSTSGSVPADANRYLSGASVTVAAAGTLVKTGCTFAGWNTIAAGTGIARTAGSSYAIGASDDTLYAQWTTNPTFTVTYNANGSTSGSVPVDANRYLSGASVSVAAAGTLVKTACTFAGWNTNAAGTGTVRAAGSSYAIGAANDTLYAQWTTNPTFTVTYNANGSTSGSVPVDANRYLSGASVSVAAAGTLVKTGSTFAGWNTNAAGTGTARVAGSSYAIGAANDTLYAQWTTNPTFTVTYNANTGSGAIPADVNKYEASALVTVQSSSTLVKTGYTFSGWNTAADGSGTARAATTTFNMPAANVTLYAQWKIKQYTVTYDVNGATAGTAPTDATRHDSATIVSVLANTGSLVKSGCIFDGWNTAADGRGTTYAVLTGSFTITGNTTLFAKWKTRTYTLTYNGNGNTGGDVPDAVVYDSNTAVIVAGNTNSLTLTGFDFNGWNSKANGSGVAMAAASTFRIKSDTTLFAQWTVKRYRLTIVPPVNGTVNLSGEVSVDSNATTTISASASSGFKFKCWRVTSGSARITDTLSASTTVRLTQGNASIKAVFACLTFNKTIGFSEYTYISDPTIAQGIDGSYYVAFCGGNPSYENTAAVMKLDLNGTTVWKQEYDNPSQNANVYSIRKTSDGCFLLCGSYNYYMHLWKIASNRNPIFSKDAGSEYTGGKVAFETRDGGYVIAGDSSGAYVRKTGSLVYDAIWAKSVSGNTTLHDGQETTDGGYVFIGDDYGLNVTKTDANGTVTWQKSFDGFSGGGRTSIRQTSDGGYIIGGQGGKYGETPYTSGLIKISATGVIEWQKKDPIGNGIKTVRQTADGGYVYLGNTEVSGAGGYDLYLVKTNARGEITWSKTFGTREGDYGYSMELCNDGGFILTGLTSDSRCIIIKTDENGNVE
jgi:uncharacterized repeat protein (TIGR02543 family)